MITFNFQGDPNKSKSLFGASRGRKQLNRHIFRQHAVSIYGLGYILGASPLCVRSFGNTVGAFPPLFNFWGQFGPKIPKIVKLFIGSPYIFSYMSHFTTAFVYGIVFDPLGKF